MILNCRDLTSPEDGRAKGNPASFGVTILFCITIILSGCVSVPVAAPQYPAVHVLPVQPGDQGYYLDTDNYNLCIWEGVPMTLFADTPRGHYLSLASFIEASEILHDKANPLPAIK